MPGGSRRDAKLLPACTTKVSEGMEIKTDSERLRKYRRMTLELLFAERNHVCAVCVANGHCELQTLAYSQGMDHVRYDYLFPQMGRGQHAPAVRHGPQPLHPLHPLRARLLAHRRRRHQERLRAAARRSQHHHRPQPAVGRIRYLHQLRQVRAWPARPARCSTKARPSAKWSATASKLEFIVTAREKKQWITRLMKL